MIRIRFALIAVIAFVTVHGGCVSSPKRFWRAAEFESPVSLDALAIAPELNPSAGAESAYAKAVALEAEDAADCVDWYLRAAELLWPTVALSSPQSSANERALRLYTSSVGKLVQTAQRYGRFDAPNAVVHSAGNNSGATPSDVALTSSSNEQPDLPVRFHGFSWQPSAFEKISVVGEYRTPDVIHPHRQAGLGVPMLIQHTSSRDFVVPHATFPATAIVRPTRLKDGTEGPRFVLDIVNPLTIRDTRVQRSTLPVAFDLTAHIAYLSVNEDRKWLEGLVRPEEAETLGLTMIEPYQPGKIPVVFVHGLASDPMTWAAMANELFVYPDLLQHFQFWIFSYPTGRPFTNEAATLRRQLVELRNHIDPERRDAALDQMVLVGHSMGGLISKLQITNSGDRLSRTIFKVPFDELEMSQDMRSKFTDYLFFEPSEQIRRVIFIGTPHRGSKLANKAGGLASRLIRQSGDLVDQCTQFVQLNRDAFITPPRRLPTSVDMLKPDNPMLQAVFELPVAAHVRMHSIIGEGQQGRFGKEPSDGVVPVSSARHPGVESELMVDAHHGLHHHPDTIEEVVRILRLHASTAHAAGENHGR